MAEEITFATIWKVFLQECQSNSSNFGTPTIASTLDTFIKQLNEYYESVEPADFDDYFEVENIKDYPKKFIVE